MSFIGEVEVAEVRGITPHYNLIFPNECDLLDVTGIKDLICELEIGHGKSGLVEPEQKELVGNSCSHNVEVPCFKVERTTLDLSDLNAGSVWMHLVFIYLPLCLMPKMEDVTQIIPQQFFIAPNLMNSIRISLFADLLLHLRRVIVPLVVERVEDKWPCLGSWLLLVEGGGEDDVLLDIE